MSATPADDQTCPTCGCTEHNPCVTPLGPCFWMPGLIEICTACARYLAGHQLRRWFPAPGRIRVSCACGEFASEAPITPEGLAYVEDMAIVHLRVALAEEAERQAA